MGFYRDEGCIDEYSCRPVGVTLKFAPVRHLTSHHYLSDCLITAVFSALWNRVSKKSVVWLMTDGR